MSNISNVKFSKKEKLEEIQAKLVLLHQKLTQQEILDKCVDFADSHFDNFVQDQIITPKLTKDKLQRIKRAVYKGDISHPNLSNDDLIYGENQQ
jgi:hypothetical protein